jgi:hypothetical protein
MKEKRDLVRRMKRHLSGAYSINKKIGGKE